MRPLDWHWCLQASLIELLDWVWNTSVFSFSIIWIGSQNQTLRGGSPSLLLNEVEMTVSDWVCGWLFAWLWACKCVCLSLCPGPCVHWCDRMSVITLTDTLLIGLQACPCIHDEQEVPLSALAVVEGQYLFALLRQFSKWARTAHPLPQMFLFSTTDIQGFI